MKWTLTLLLPAAAAAAASPPVAARGPAGLDQALRELTRQGKFSGAVVVRGADGVRFARGYGWADPFTRRRFTPGTPADSGSLAKPVTAAAVLLLVRDGKVALDAPVRRYLPEDPHAAATVRHLLSHSAGLELKQSPEGLANKNNAELLAATGAPLFAPGTRFTYCNLCSITLALLIERVSGVHYLEFAKQRLALPASVSLRPGKLADWSGRAIGYRRTRERKFERFDSWEGERFYGAANLSVSANQLARWGSEWWRPRLSPIRPLATRPANVGLGRSGLTLGNWYCADGGRRCHYLGHHEGFHHMLYWDVDRRTSIAMLSNNALSPAFHQRLQRALAAFAEGRPERARRELALPLAESDVPVGRFALASGETVEIVAAGQQRLVRRRGVEYPAYPTGSGIRYVPGLDVYLAGARGGRLHWLSLYEDYSGTAARAGR